MADQDAASKTVEEIGMDTLRDTLTDVVGRASYTKERFAVTRNGRRIAGLVGIEDLERLIALDAA